jgi:hypothetical protein
MNARQFRTALVVGLCVWAWVQFSEHPTAQNLKEAIRDTLPLL